MERPIRTAAKAMIIRDGKLLAVKIRQGEDFWYIMPGGGQDPEELLPETAAREAAEELGIRVKVRELAFVIEGRHGEAFHRIDLVFACDYVEKLPSPKLQGDTHQDGYDWLELKTLNTAPLYPSRLRRAIMHYAAGIPHPVYLGNEEMGDPEITD